MTRSNPSQRFIEFDAPETKKPKHRTAVTSRLAHEAARPTASKMARRILRLVEDAGHRGLTRYEIADAIRRPIQSVCRPVRDLIDLGALIEDGDMRLSPHGRPAHIVRVPTGVTSDVTTKTGTQGGLSDGR